jgi:hypothetical protein
MAFRKVILLLIALVVIGPCVYDGAMRALFGPRGQTLGYRLGDVQIAENGAKSYVLVDEDERYQHKWHPVASRKILDRLAWNRIVVLDKEGIVSSAEAPPRVTVNSNIATLFGFGPDLFIYEDRSWEKPPRLFRVTSTALELIAHPESGGDGQLAELFRRANGLGPNEISDLLNEATLSSEWRIVIDSAWDLFEAPSLALLDGAVEIGNGDPSHFRWDEIAAEWKSTGKREIIASDGQITPVRRPD